MLFRSLNNGTDPAVLYASLTSQSPGMVFVGDALFSAPAIPEELLARTLLTDGETVENIRANFGRRSFGRWSS